MNWLDHIENPILTALLAEADAKGGLTIVQFESFINRAIGDAPSTGSLWRVGQNSVPMQTNAVALYTSAVSDGTSGVQASTIAQDLSLRSPEIVALDTTNLGRLVIQVDRAFRNVGGEFAGEAKEGELRLHPNVPRLVDEETLERLGLKAGVQG